PPSTGSSSSFDLTGLCCQSRPSPTRNPFRDRSSTSPSLPSPTRHSRVAHRPLPNRIRITPEINAMPFFSRVFKSRGAGSKKASALDVEGVAEKPKPRWEDSWSRTELDSEEIRELVHEVTQEMKSRGTSCF